MDPRRFREGLRIISAMISTALLLVVSLSARAQTRPAAPTPADMAADISARAEKDPAGAGASLNDLFKKLGTPGAVLPSLKQAQQDGAKRSFAAPAGDEPGQDNVVLGVPRAQDYQIGYTRVSGDLSFIRPLPRVELGAGVVVNDVYLGNQLLSRDSAATASLRFNLDHVAPRPKLFHAPTLTYNESDLTPSHTLVGSRYYGSRELLHALTHPFQH